MSEISSRGVSSIESHDSLGTVYTEIVVARFSITGVDESWGVPEGVRMVLLIGLFNTVSDVVSLRLGQWMRESVEHLNLLWWESSSDTDCLVFLALLPPLPRSTIGQLRGHPVSVRAVPIQARIAHQVAIVHHLHVVSLHSCLSKAAA